MKLLVIASFSESLLNFRGAFLDLTLAHGYEVHVAAPGLSAGSLKSQQLQSRGWFVHDIRMQRASFNPISDFDTLLSLRDLMCRTQPYVVLCYAIKPVIYGILAAWWVGVPRRYALITGLGYAFIGRARGLRRIANLVVQGLYRLALRRAHKVFFQNPDDEALFRQLDLLQPSVKSVVVNGSGVDLEKYTSVPTPRGPPHFLLIARLIGDKGVREFVQAAQRIKVFYPQTKFSLLGWIDENPDAIKQWELDSWVEAGTINYLGRLDDVRPAIRNCSVYVLPSYREGTPRTVLEAMAMGRAIITTDVPGCRETVTDGDNGFLVPARSIWHLEQAMKRFIDVPLLAQLMGRRSRLIAQKKYDVHKVNAVMLREMDLE